MEYQWVELLPQKLEAIKKTISTTIRRSKPTSTIDQRTMDLTATKIK